MELKRLDDKEANNLDSRTEYLNDPTLLIYYYVHFTTHTSDRISVHESLVIENYRWTSVYLFQTFDVSFEYT